MILLSFVNDIGTVSLKDVALLYFSGQDRIDD